MTTLANAIRDAASRLPGEEARLEAELLLAHALQRPRSWFYAHAGDVLDPGEAQAFDQLLRRRDHGEPVAQIVGHRGFWSLDLAVTPDTLIPGRKPNCWSKWRSNTCRPSRWARCSTWAPAPALSPWPSPANGRWWT